jgi:DNA-binding NarL/FixJ family response regulator
LVLIVDESIQFLNCTARKQAADRIALEIQLQADALLGTDHNGLPPRMGQTLMHLLHGESEKQIASKLNISRHTVHIYVKQLYRRFEVHSRAELMARYIATRREGT